MRASVLSKKGWVVIPRDLRDRYGLKEGDRVHIVDYGGVISIVPVTDAPITDSLGMLKGKTSLTARLLKERERDARSDR